MLKRFLKNQKGMTLIEIMVVVAIIGGITALIAVNVTGSSKQANIKLTRTQISNLMTALDHYNLDNHEYPTTDQGLDALVHKPSSGSGLEDYPDGGYLKKVPKDSWGKPFNFASPGTHGNAVEVWSNGPDRQEGNDDDIPSWDLEEGGN